MAAAQLSNDLTFAVAYGETLYLTSDARRVIVPQCLVQMAVSKPSSVVNGKFATCQYNRDFGVLVFKWKPSQSTNAFQFVVTDPIHFSAWVQAESEPDGAHVFECRRAWCSIARRVTADEGKHLIAEHRANRAVVDLAGNTTVLDMPPLEDDVPENAKADASGFEPLVGACAVGDQLSIATSKRVEVVSLKLMRRVMCMNVGVVKTAKEYCDVQGDHKYRFHVSRKKDPIREFFDVHIPDEIYQQWAAWMARIGNAPVFKVFEIEPSKEVDNNAHSPAPGKYDWNVLLALTSASAGGNRVTLTNEHGSQTVPNTLVISCLQNEGMHNYGGYSGYAHKMKDVDNTVLHFYGGGSPPFRIMLNNAYSFMCWIKGLADEEHATYQSYSGRMVTASNFKVDSERAVVLVRPDRGHMDVAVIKGDTMDVRRAERLYYKNEHNKALADVLADHEDAICVVDVVHGLEPDRIGELRAGGYSKTKFIKVTPHMYESFRILDHYKLAPQQRMCMINVQHSIPYHDSFKEYAMSILKVLREPNNLL